MKCCELDEHYDLMEGVKNVELMEFEEPYSQINDCDRWIELVDLSHWIMIWWNTC